MQKTIQKTMISLSPKQRQTLREQHRQTKNRTHADRIKTILLLDEGWSYEEVARILLLDDSTVRSYQKQYDQNGLDALLTDHFSGGQKHLSPMQIEHLKTELRSTIYVTAADICHYVDKTFGVSYTPEGMVKLLHAIGFSYKKTKRIPGKADAKQQEAFLKDVYEATKTKMQPDDQLYFADGAHPQHNVVTSYGWIEKGTEKEVRSNTGRKRLNINGAINLNHEVVMRTDDSINADSTVALYKQLEAKHPIGTIYVVEDNARYYRAKLVQDYLATSRVVPLFLPPYSPNLNLIERLWKFMHKEVLHNQYYDTYDKFKAAVHQFFDRINAGGYAAQLDSLLTENFHIIGAAA
jgi:transposase